MALLLADILPTGCFAVKQAVDHQNLKNVMGPGAALVMGPQQGGSGDLAGEKIESRPLKIAVVGLGPVGVVSKAMMLHDGLESMTNI